MILVCATKNDLTLCVYNVCSFLWHRVSCFLFSLIKIIIRFKNAQKERKAVVDALVSAMVRLPERLASLNQASDSRRLAFLALSSEEKAVWRWQVLG